MWERGRLSIYGDVFHYRIKCCDKPSAFGIAGGKITKLLLKRNGVIVAKYDRDWIVEIADMETQLACEKLLYRVD